MRHWINLVEDQVSWSTILQKLMEHPRFKAWFKNSIITDDETGLPELCFHWGRGDYRLPKPFTHYGTSDAAEMRFLDVKEFRKVNGRDFEGGHTTPVLLSIQKPYWIDDLGKHRLEDYIGELHRGSQWMEDQPILSDEQVEQLQGIDEARAWLMLAQMVQQAGYDGFGYYNEKEGDQSWIILRPGQAMPFFKLAALVM